MLCLSCTPACLYSAVNLERTLEGLSNAATLVARVCGRLCACLTGRLWIDTPLSIVMYMQGQTTVDSMSVHSQDMALC